MHVIICECIVIAFLESNIAWLYSYSICVFYEYIFILGYKGQMA